MSKITLTIVIPAYNEEGCIEECLESIALQSEKPDEVIVVDNNSTDRTSEIARSFPFVKVIKEPEQGISYAHHAGFNIAKGDYIARIDADSVLTKNWVSLVNNFYSSSKNQQSCLVGTGYAINLRFKVTSKYISNTAHIVARVLLGHWALWGPNMVMPRECWDKIGAKTCEEKPSTYDDLDMSMHAHEEGYKIFWNRNIVVGVRLRHLKTFRKFVYYNMRWPRTLRAHGNWRWTYSWPMVGFFAILHFPLLYSLSKREK